MVQTLYVQLIYSFYKSLSQNAVRRPSARSDVSLTTRIALIVVLTFKKSIFWLQSLGFVVKKLVPELDRSSSNKVQESFPVMFEVESVVKN